MENITIHLISYFTIIWIYWHITRDIYWYSICHICWYSICHICWYTICSIHNFITQSYWIIYWIYYTYYSHKYICYDSNYNILHAQYFLYSHWQLFLFHFWFKLYAVLLNLHLQSHETCLPMFLLHSCYHTKYFNIYVFYFAGNTYFRR